MSEARRMLVADDEAGRRAAQSEYRRPLVLEAGAGTGKTTTLVARILGWCLGAGWEEALAAARAAQAAQPAPSDAKSPPPITSERLASAVLQGLVSITFTEAAAAEMASRVAEALSLVASGKEDQVVGLDLDAQSSLPPAAERIERARALLGNLDHLTATTIHAFCLNLLVQHPLEAGVHPNLAIDPDGTLVEETVHEVLEQRFAAAWADNDPNDPLLGLAAVGIGPDRIGEAAIALSSKGSPAGALGADPLGGSAVDHLARELEAATGAVAAQLAPAACALTGSALAPRVAEALLATRTFLQAPTFSGVAGATELRDFVAEAWPEKLVDRIGLWSHEGQGVRETQLILDPVAMSRGCRDLKPLLTHIRSLDPALLDLGRRALAPLLQAVEVSLRSRGVATFSFLLTAARDLLAGNAPLRRRIRRRIRQLLVDEFQDTDGLQCDIIRHLALEGPADERPGLFLVGDPKQSIYGWRSADLAAYDGFKAAAIANGGAIHGLHRNFRSVTPILDEVERAIGPVMIEAPEIQPRFAPLLVSQRLENDTGFTFDGRRPVEYWVSWMALDPDSPSAPNPKTLADPVAILEAEAVAADIRFLHDTHAISWSDFGLLFRSTGRIDTYLSALRNAGVPFAVTKDKHYYRRREVIEAAAVLRTIVNPADHLALLTYLRSPSAGLPDAAILPLWRDGFPARMTALHGPGDDLDKITEQVRLVARQLPTDVSGLDRIPDWQESVVVAIRSVAILRQAYAAEPADLFLDRVRRLVLLEATEAARYLGPFRLANLDRFFRGVEKTMEERSGNVRASLRAIHRKVQEAREEEEARPKDSVDDAVQVMTIHGAKGLEFAHLYLVGTHSEMVGRPARNDFDERWDPATPPEYRIFGAPTPGFYRIKARRQRVADAEQVRTLYVALTRACRRLVVLGKWPEVPTPRSWQDSGSHLQLLESRTDQPDSIVGLWDQCVAAGESSVVDRGVRWVFPALEPKIRISAQPPDSPTAPGFPTETVVHRISDLERRRRAAAEQMRRPLSGTPSRRESHRLSAEPEDASQPPSEEAGEIDRQAALAAGTALHNLLETWDFTAEFEVELEHRRARFEDSLETDLADAVHRAAVERLERLVERLSGNDLLERLAALGPHIVARELPLTLAPSESDEATGFISGIIDLLYRNPDSDRLTIADYKTNRIDTEDELEALRERYRPQLEIYRRAVAGFYPDEPPPRCELWMLWADRILEL